ncbi:hypothetical protein D3C81_907010 [compost metagenome]
MNHETNPSSTNNTVIILLKFCEAIEAFESISGSSADNPATTVVDTTVLIIGFIDFIESIFIESIDFISDKLNTTPAPNPKSTPIDKCCFPVILYSSFNLHLKDSSLYLLQSHPHCIHLFD